MSAAGPPPGPPPPAGDGFGALAELVTVGAEVPRFRPDPVPAELLDEIVAAATVAPRETDEPPWRVVAVVGDARDALIGHAAEALSRHWGHGAVRPRGLASEAVLAAPVLLLVFSRVPASEALEQIVQVASAAQNVALLAAARGLATHRIVGAHLVPEPVVDVVAGDLGPSIRTGELVSMLAIGWPAAPPRPPAAPTRLEWIGLDVEARPLVPPDPTTFITPAAVLRSPGGERVLVGDPYRYNQDLLRRLLAAAGYEVEVFSDGRALLARAAGEGGVKLHIVSDGLPDQSGFELVRAVRAAGRGAPLIVTTARRDAAFRIGGLAAGVDYYLRKPINPIELYTAARILLERQRRGEELARANVELSRLVTELRDTQARLVQQAKMASLGQLVAGVAHEINTPLGAVVSNNDLFLRCFARLRDRARELGVERDPQAARDLQAVEELSEVTRTACARITGIVKELRTFARLDEADRKTVDLHEGLESTLVLLSHMLKGRIDVRRRYGDLPPIECHPGQVNQVFMNLLVNACHAIAGEGTITLRTWHDAARGRVSVAVGDTGSGIPRENLARIFDPGFTTKGAGVGTGLGLSICYQIASAHGGDITVESEVGRGTVFTLSLPAPG